MLPMDKECVRMLRRAMDLVGFHQVIFICHTPLVSELADMPSHGRRLHCNYAAGQAIKVNAPFVHSTTQTEPHCACTASERCVGAESVTAITAAAPGAKGTPGFLIVMSICGFGPPLSWWGGGKAAVGVNSEIQFGYNCNRGVS